MTDVTHATSPLSMALVALARRVERSNRKRAVAREGMTASIRVRVLKTLLQICAFASLTVAGFSFSFLAGMITLSVSLFVLSWLIEIPESHDPQSTVHNRQR